MKNINDFIYHRICRLNECNAAIHTNRKDYHFCCPNHQQEYWRRKRKERRKIETMILNHEERIKKIEKKLEIK